MRVVIKGEEKFKDIRKKYLAYATEFEDHVGKVSFLKPMITAINMVRDRKFGSKIRR